MQRDAPAILAVPSRCSRMLWLFKLRSKPVSALCALIWQQLSAGRGELETSSGLAQQPTCKQMNRDSQQA